MTEKLISVIVPVYNAEKYIERCVNSIINQTYKNLEIILIDDGSQDNSGVLCDGLAKTDERIRVIHKQNGGVSAARNSGLDISYGEYITFVDSDDYIEKNMYEIMMKYACDADITACGYLEENVVENKIREIKNDEEVLFLDRKRALYNFSKMPLYSYCWNKLYKKSILVSLSFDNEIMLAEDLLFSYEAINNSKTMVMIDKCLYHYCVYGESLSNGKIRKSHFTAHEKVYSVILNDLKKNHPEEEDTIKEWEVVTLVRLLDLCVVSCVSKEFKNTFLYLRNDSLQYKNVLMCNESKNIFSIKERIKLFTLWHCPAVFKLLIKTNMIIRRLRK